MSSAQLAKFAAIKPADIEWRDGLPYSREFDDIYFAPEDGLAESTYVFIEGNQLAGDWADPDREDFYLAELGFGSGLNFLITAALWRDQIIAHKSDSTKRLHYVSIEKRPLSLDDFKKACAHWPQFSDIAAQLAQFYPSLTYGRHQITFASLNLTLTLFFMPVDEALDDLIEESTCRQNSIHFDHWFLDGFAPAKNTSMWGENLSHKIARLSRIGSRLATFSVAAAVKKPLITAGFEIKKLPGFGRKREMLTAILTSQTKPKPASTYINLKYEKPWFQSSTQVKPERVAIIGAGIAGCATALALTQKGINVTLYDAQAQIAAGASGAAAGIFHPQLTSDMNLGSQFSWLAYLHLLRFLSTLDQRQASQVMLSRGLTRLLPSNALAQQLLELADTIGISEWIKPSSAFSTCRRAVDFPLSAALDLRQCCHLLLEKIPDSHIQLRLNTQVDSLNFSRNQWQLASDSPTDSFDQVVFCVGAHSPLLKTLSITATNTTRGQTCLFEHAALAEKITQPLSEKIYLVPRATGQFHLGTTFDDFIDNNLNPASQNDMLTGLNSCLASLNLPTLSAHEQQSIPLKGTLGYRLHSQDRLPMVGPAVDHEKLRSDFKSLGQRRIERQSLSHYNRPGLWLNTAYGSHGLLFAMLAGEHLSRLISNDISPLETALSQALSPARFAIKECRA